MNYKVIDNFLPEESAKNIFDVMIGNVAQFPWYYNNTVVHIDSGKDFINNYQFTHGFYSDWKINSGYYNLIEPILDRLNPYALVRVKANLNHATSYRITYDWHVDFEGNNKNSKTAIYYVNDNDGATILENGIEVESVFNRLLVFDQSMKHTGTTCTNEKVRCVINFNYVEFG